MVITAAQLGRLIPASHLETACSEILSAVPSDFCVIPRFLRSSVSRAPGSVFCCSIFAVLSRFCCFRNYIITYFVQLFNNQSVQSAREKNNSSVITDISRTEPAEFFAQFFLGFFQKPLAISIGMCYNNSVNHESLSCAQLRAAI